MQENFIRITCPECHANFRVNPDDIPAEGAYAACKKCGRRFSVRKPETNSVSEIPIPVFLSDQSEKPADTLFTCPQCGHRQKQPYTCYTCGAVITPREPAPGSAVATASVPPTAPPEPLAMLKQDLGEIVIRARILSHPWLQTLTQVHINIDGMDFIRDWGVHAFDVPRGDCIVDIKYKFLFFSFGRNRMSVPLSASERIYVYYRIESSLTSTPGRLNRATLAEGALWKIPTKSGLEADKENSNKRKVGWALLFLGPLGLIPLWRSDAFSTNAKLVITLAMVLMCFWVIMKI